MRRSRLLNPASLNAEAQHYSERARPEKADVQGGASFDEPGPIVCPEGEGPAADPAGTPHPSPASTSAHSPALEPLVVSVKDAGHMLGISRSTVFELLASNALERVKINGSITRVTIASIRKLAGA
jgi:hypothetical protein